jgi:hypothetical protein
MMDKELVTDSFERELYSAMSEGKPLKRYMKTILGKVYVTTLNPFDNGKPQPIELYGQPRPGNSRAVVEIWTSKEDRFFKKVNEAHFKAGNLRLLEDKDIEKVSEEPKSPNEISDAEIEEILNKPYMALKNKLNKFTAPAPVYRFLRMAEELEKSEKITDSIKARLSELEFGSTEEEESEAK